MKGNLERGGQAGGQGPQSGTEVMSLEFILNATGPPEKILNRQNAPSYNKKISLTPFKIFRNVFA